LLYKRECWIARPDPGAHLRDGIKGLVYFRDPSGNLLEIYCPKLDAAASFVRGAKQGGSYEIDFAPLNYDWQG
jgi:hypothetical protein